MRNCVAHQICDCQRERMEQLRKVLDELVCLKDLKDSQGKTFEYQFRQPYAWEMARKALAEFDASGAK